MQPIAARRAGRVSPWQDQPEIRRSGCVEALHEAEAGRRVAGAVGKPSSVTVPNLLSMTPAASSSRMPSGSIRAAMFGDRRSRLAQFAAGAVDFQFSHRLFARRGPAEDVLAAALGMPEYLVSLCFAG